MFHVLRQVFGKPWLIEPNEAQRLLDAFMPVWEGRTTLVSQADTRSVEVVVKSGVGIVPISGPIMKEDQYCGGVGTATLANTLNDLANNNDIRGIVLQIDSPGGTVDGTQTFSNLVKAIGKKKPVVAFVDGMMASAAYWIGSSANHIMASTKTDIIGSIGTMVQWADMSERYKAAGIKVHEAYASESTDKNRMFRDANATGDYTAIIKDFLDPVNNEFLSAVKANREGKLRGKENVFTGKIYMAKDAMRHGLIDSIGTLDQAVAMAAKLASSTNQPINKSTMTLQAKYPNLATTAQWPEGAEALDNGSVEMTAEELARTEQALADGASAAANLVILTKKHDDLKAELATAQQALADAQAAAAADTVAAENATLKSEISNLKSEIAKLGGKVEAPAETKAEEDAQAVTTKPRRKYAHEQYAEDLGL